jgi:hypothetical protein
MAILTPNPRFKAFDANGNPLAGGKLFSYVANTSTPQATYTDSTEGATNTNPVILDSAGEASVWLGEGLNYKLVLKDSSEATTFWTVDSVPGALAMTSLTVQSLTVTDAITGSLTGNVTGNVTGTVTGNVVGSVTGNVTGNLTGVVTSTGNSVFKRINGIYFADQFSGATSGDKIWAAHNQALADGGGLVIVPSTLAAGESPNQFSDDVLVMDLRGTAQSQGLRFNVPVLGAGLVRSKMLLQDNFGADTVGLDTADHSCTHYVLTYVDKPETTTGTIAAANATLCVNSQAGDSTGPLIGGEFSANVNATNGTPRTCADIRGVLGNAAVGGNTSVTQAVSVYGQAITKTGTGTITDAISGKFEKQTAGTVNLSVWAVGKSKFNESISVGDTNPQAGIGVFVKPEALTGGTQIGLQSAPISTVAATTTGEGIRARCDTVAASFTQALNMGISVENPTKGAGSTITEANGIRVADITEGATNRAIKTLGNALSEFTGGITCPIRTPASAAAAGVAGEIRWDASYIYICTATNTWKRVAIATW